MFASKEAFLKVIQLKITVEKAKAKVIKNAKKMGPLETPVKVKGKRLFNMFAFYFKLEHT